MDYMTKREIAAYKIDTDDVNIPVKPLSGYYYWYCPRCKKALDVAGDRFVSRCLNCRQMIQWK